MRRHIKIKVKTILILIVLAGVLLLSDTIYWQGIKLYNAIAPEPYKIALDQISTKTLMGENQRLSQIFSENDYQIFMLVTIEDGYMLGGMRIRTEDAEKIYASFLEYDKAYKLYDDYPEYVINVALSQWFSGNVQRATVLLDRFTDENISDDVRLVRTGMHIGLYEFDKAVSVLGTIKTDKYSEVIAHLYYFLNTYMAIEIEDAQTEKPIYLSDQKGYIKLFRSIFDLNHNVKDYVAAQNTIVTAKANKSISGHVLINEQPVQGAFIYGKSYNGMRSNYFEKMPQTTDQAGYYRIDDASDDTLGIGIAISWHIIQDKQITRNYYAFMDPLNTDTVDLRFNEGVKFKSLEIIGDALRYEIEDPNQSEDRTYRIIVKHTDPKYDIYARAYSEEIVDDLSGTISLDRMRLNSRLGFEFSTSHDELAIERFIEPLYLSDAFQFSVDVNYPNETDTYVINGLYTDRLSKVIEVEAQPVLSDGDELIAQGYVEEAMAWYTKNQSLHALKVLAALYTKGYRVEESMEFSQVLSGSDPEKAIVYTEALIDQYGKTEDLKLNLATLYEAHSTYDKAAQIYSELISEAPENQFYHLQYAQMLINEGNFNAGIDYYTEHVTSNKQNYGWNSYFVLGNVPAFMAVELLTNHSQIENVASFERFHKLIRQGDYIEAYDWLEKANDSALKTMYTLLWEDVFGTQFDKKDYVDFVAHYIESTNRIKNTHIRNVLKAIKRYNNWF
jgi:tetratricopeptide (TPR) repeat protein